MKIALLGAGGTGKTRLAGELAAQLRQRGRSVAVVQEVLPAGCRRAGHDFVIADTSALTVAICSSVPFADGELSPFALEWQRRYDLTLLTGLDLPWLAGALQGAGPQLREEVDAQIRKALAEAGIAYRVVYGQGGERVASALAAIDSGSAGEPAAGARRWQWNCDKCCDAQCEHRLFTAKIAAP